MSTTMRFRVSPEDQRIAGRVAAARRMADISQDQLARRITRRTGEEWTGQQVANMETGRKQIVAGMLVVLGEALDVDPGWFLSGPPRAPGRVLDIPGSLKVAVAA